MHAAIVAQTLEDCQKIFQYKLKYAFDQMRPDIRALFRIVGDSAKELSFAHGSSIRVGTSLRSSTLQYLHVSEFGKICAKSPEKAREIITGSLNTVHAGQRIFIESTAEGKEGKFYDMVQLARSQKKDGIPLTPMDFKFFFLSWWRKPEYALDQPVIIPAALVEYFAKLSLEGIELTNQQKWWYAKKWETQGEDMHREFPTNADEAFSVSQEGYWHAIALKELYDAGRVRDVTYDKAIPVHTASDLGQRDQMATWFFQINRSDEINVIDFWMKGSTPIEQYALMLKSKGYVYGTHIWPHDANARDKAGVTFVQQARNFQLSGLVLEPHGLIDGINLVRTTLSKCWFDKNKCASGLKYLENYKKKWNSSFGGWTSEPVHDEASHAADAFRYLCAGIKKLSASSGSIEGQYAALRKYWG